jgi:hypothetical protein
MKRFRPPAAIAIGLLPYSAVPADYATPTQVEWIARDVGRVRIQT